MQPRTGPGLSTRMLGQRGGSENETLNINQIPSHVHNIPASSSHGTSLNPHGRVIAKDSGEAAEIYNDSPNGNLSPTANTGGSLSHNNVQPFLCVNFIIALQGIYPSRN